MNLAYDIEELTYIMREFDDEVSKLMFIQAYKKQMKTYAIEQQKLKKMEMIQSMKVVPSDEENLQREGDGKRTSSR